VAALHRQPPRAVTWKGPTPSCSAPLKSSLRGRPTCCPAAIKASASGLRRPRSLTASGPPALRTRAAAEVGQHFLRRPAGAAELPPVVEVRVLAAHVEQPVDGGRAAQHPAARPGYAPAVQLGLRLGGQVPGQGGVVHGLGVADGHVQPRVARRAAGFQQQHAGAGVLRQPCRQGAAGGTSADDDVVGFLGKAAHAWTGPPTVFVRWSEPRPGAGPPQSRFRDVVS
jgi:hypothetical protein